tara:strand:+ start:942 stop:1358 length:417 start_codon:yes stop_codon:yes gene_type:complete
MKLSTIYILKHKLPLELVYQISEYEQTTYKNTKSNITELSELDMTIYVYPIHYFIHSLYEFVNYIYIYEIYKDNYNKQVIASLTHLLNEYNELLYDLIYNVDLNHLDYYNKYMSATAKDLIQKTIQNLTLTTQSLILE